MRPNLNFGRHVLNQIETGITKEWIETNGLGSYAMGTIVGANTRRYHALFLVTSDSSFKKTLLVNRMEESILLHGQRIECSCQEYPGTISPQGHLYLESFRALDFPRWVYAVNDLKIEKTFFMRSGEETSVLIYKHLMGPTTKLILRPFISCRDVHDLIREDQRFSNAIKIENHQIHCTAAGSPEFYMMTVGKPQDTNENIKIYADGYWYKNLLYAHEEERELAYQEDLFSPCQIHAELSAGQQIALIFSNQQKQNVDVEQWIKDELFVREKIFENFSIQGPFAKRCAIAADQFLIRNKMGATIVSGYPWHQNTVREELMSLPGICLSTGRKEEARSILSRCSRLIKQGLLPSQMAENEPLLEEYSNMDASLWFVWAVQKYFETTKDLDFIKEMRPSVDTILQSYRGGIKLTDQNNLTEIRMDSDGLIWGQSSLWPLTWMNGKVNDWIVTPRKGKPVEVQALWYNALQFYSEILLKMEGTDHGWGELAKTVRSSFNSLFWNAQNNYLYDAIEGNLREGSIRPNALYAISMPYEILDTEKFKPVLETAWKILYTSFGLRTLSPTEPHYHGIFSGDERNRASAAFNGSVFPFLIGPFLTAFFKTYGRDQNSKEQAIHFLTPFISHLSDSGLGSISELFDGNSPHNPRGGVADCRGVGEILRVMKEEGLEL